MIAALLDLSMAGMADTYNSRFDFEVVGHGMRQRKLDQSPVSIPNQFRTGHRGINSGVFKEMTLTEALNLCFTPEALALLVKHTYNEWVFWNNLNYFCGWFFIKPMTESLPFTEELVSERLFPTKVTPFGVKTSTTSDYHMGRLKDAVRENGGTFNPNKLPAAYAVHLLLSGFLLKVNAEGYAAPHELMVNPKWQHVIDEVVAQTARS